MVVIVSPMVPVRCFHEQTNHNQGRPDNNMQYVISSTPLKMALWKPIHETRRRLIKINQTKRNIESADQILFPADYTDHSDDAENNVKNVVGKSIAHQTIRKDEAKSTG